MRAVRALVCCLALLVLLVPLDAPAGVRDDTAWLQARLDAGGTIDLPRLPDGQCYQSRGLWVDRDGTQIVSDGACIVSLGPGAVRLTSADGDPVAADAVFYVNHGTPLLPAPDHVTIRGLTIVVPAASGTSGISVLGHDVLIQDVTVTGSPEDDVYVGDRANGDGYASRVVVDQCVLEGGGRNVVSATSFLDLTIENSTIRGATGAYARATGEDANPAAGIDVEPNKRGNLVLGLRIAGNVISGNAGPGILFALTSATGRPYYADRLLVTGNRIVGNGKGGGAERGGIVFVGGQADGQGHASVTGNTIAGNAGAGLVGRDAHLVLQSRGNDLTGNGGGPLAGLERLLPARESRRGPR
jgi:hypothetical protein